MIYKFNEYSEEKRYPKRASLDQILEKRRIHKDINFTQFERQKIDEILMSRNIRYDLHPFFLEIFKGAGGEIIKHTDEWFTIVYSERYGSIQYFICDEFEEVETFLNIML